MRLFVDNLTNVDFSYLCPERGLVGETWLASIALDGALDEQGMICDFGFVKKHLRHWLDVELDHKLLIPTHSSALQLNTDSLQIDAHWQFGNQHYLATQSPKESVALISQKTITPESVAQWCEPQIRKLFDAGVDQLHLSFAPETIATPFYHYSHGLKKHLGNCQRIAHGHRSKILVWRNGSLCLDTMNEIATLWRDIYIGTKADLLNSVNETQYKFAYTAQQGDYRLELPASVCYLMNADSTVENISAHLLQRLSLLHPQDTFEVKAFEGIAKGAISKS